jgi:hypothetical protein
MTGYYDLVLGLIPLALVGITGVLHAAGLALSAAIPVGGLLAILLVGHALFVNAPVDSPPSSSSSTQSVSFDAAD